MSADKNLRVLYEQHQFPIFQNRMYSSEREALECPRGDIRLVEDLRTGLVYNAAFLPELMAYDRNYQNEQGNSGSFRLHLQEVAKIVSRTLGTESLVEVGCGKGLFIDILSQHHNAEIVGFDPTYEGDDLRIQKQYFSHETGISGTGIIMRHVLEHIQNPVDFLIQIKEANGGKGKIYIEVPCFDWICKQKAWFDIFYEHVNYFRLADFKRIFGHIIECGHLFNGQYIYVVADLCSINKPIFDPCDRPAWPADFLEVLNKFSHQGPSDGIIWGGASKGVIFSLICQRYGFAINQIIDINPAKQGKYIAATGLRVHSPNEVIPYLSSDATILVMNSNYLEEIMEITKKRFNYAIIEEC
ncbi:class I SAM-dependent methyltransferase [Pectobacterium punjabense]|uniref:class I SAM-dependent methyltransferase n=1 Tax=Pectobacterium punjabense TaxID=2108399 RepID=UPI001969A1A9|nr:class I SAM-dependent methyltransferase [Pectobacterium punjabense]